MKNTMQLPAPPDTVNVYDELYKALEKCNKLSPLDSVTYKKFIELSNAIVNLKVEVLLPKIHSYPI